MYREEKIIKLIKNKNILDIGSTGDDVGNDFLFKTIKNEAKKITGIDILPCPHPEVVQGNMETYDFKKKFDVIIAGDIIEHVQNQGLFLKNVKNHLVKSGKFVLTTPNAKWWTIIFKPHTEHMLWHDKYTLLKILKANNFKIVEMSYYPGNREKINLIKRMLYKKRQIFVICEKQ